MISLQKHFLFVHIPKTAGNSLQNILAPYSEDKITKNNVYQDGVERFNVVSQFGTTKHSTLKEYARSLSPELYSQLFKFSCVRNPWDRAISYFFSPHRGQTEWDRQKFIRFIPTIKPMIHYLTLDQLNLNEIHHIIRYENLAEDYQHLCHALEIPHIPLPHRNKAKKKPYQHYYDQELIDVVAAQFKADIELFDYHF